MSKDKTEKNLCARYNDVGECIQWVRVGDEFRAEFKEEAKACSPKLFQEFAEKVKNNKIVMRV